MSLFPDSFVQSILETACCIQQISAPTFHEEKRSLFSRDFFQVDGLRDVDLDEVGNVYACVPGERSGAPLVLTAHMDSVFPASFPLTLDRQPARITGPGIGDNALGLSTLLNLPRILRECNLKLPGDVWLVATVCEEGLGNLRGMQAVTERFNDRPVAYISLEGIGFGNVLHRGLGVERYRIHVHTAGGHSWVDYGNPSAVHELISLANKITGLRIPRRPRTTMNVGTIQGGTSINTIAATASLELDLRSENARNLQDLTEKVLQTAGSVARTGVDVEVERIGWRPAGSIPADHSLVSLCEEIIRDLGVNPHLDIASTEANLPLSLGYPSVTLGLTTGDRAHSAQEYINIAPLDKGLSQIIQVLERAWNI